MKMFKSLGFIEFVLGMMLVILVIYPITVGIMASLLPDKPRPGDPGYIEIRYISNDELDELIDMTASRKEVVDRYGKPLRYRESKVSYETCEQKNVWVCNEIVLEFDIQDVLSGYYNEPKKPQPDVTVEDMNLRELGKKGDEVAER